MHRHVTGYLWRFALFRLGVIKYVSAGLPGTVWLATETPLLLSLRDLHLDQGNLGTAAECANVLRSNGDL